MSHRILFVEDEVLYSDIIIDLRKKVSAIFCGDSELIVLRELGMAKHVLATNHILLVILDLGLPDSLQPDTITWVSEVHQQWPIYVVTGDERMETRDKCLLAGAAGFAIKKHVLESPNFFFAGLYNSYVMHARDHGNAPQTTPL